MTDTSLGLVSPPVWPVHPLRQPSVVALVRGYHTNKLICLGIIRSCQFHFSCSIYCEQQRFIPGPTLSPVRHSIFL
jgi:hypothetical protein